MKRRIALAAEGGHSLGLKKECLYLLAGDLNNDCSVRFHDLSSMVSNSGFAKMGQKRSRSCTTVKSPLLVVQRCFPSRKA